MAMVGLLARLSTIPTFISASTDFQQPATTTTTSPAGIAVGDLLVTFLHSGSPSVAAPVGWTAQIGPSSDTFKSWACYTKTAASGDVGATFTWTPSTSGNPMHAVTIVLRGGTIVVVDAGATATNGGGQYPTAPSVTASAGGALLVCGLVADRGVFSGDPTPLGVPTGMTYRAEIGGGGGGLLVTTETVPAGATGVRDSTTPWNPSYNVGMSLAVHG